MLHLRFVCTLSLVLLGACTGYPDTIRPVSPFALQPYLGTWYEIARLDHRFERGLSRVSAEYSLNDDGSVRVRNRGWNQASSAWEEAIGRARFVEGTDTGYLKVSFFGPFYGSYVIFELGPNHEYAFVAGPDTRYLWLLARSPTIDDALYARFVTRAAAAGFDTSALIRIAHD